MKSGGGRPTGGYFLADGTKKASVTTITGRGKDSGGLIYVAKRNWHEAGRKGLPFERDAYWSDKDALQIGSIVHQWIEDDIHDRPLTKYPDLPPAVLTDATSGFSGYAKWRQSANVEVIATEVPLISEEYGYGGTLDAIAYVGGEPALLDWKTSNKGYPEYVAQLAAYRQLIDEAHDDYPSVDEAYLLRIGKTYGDFHLNYYPKRVLDDGWQWFLHAKGLYELDKPLKGVVS